MLSNHGREILIEYRPSDDSLYVNINDSDASVSSTKSIDSRREVDYAAVSYTHLTLPTKA